jgi:hypothetical protein
MKTLKDIKALGGTQVLDKKLHTEECKLAADAANAAGVPAGVLGTLFIVLKDNFTSKAGNDIPKGTWFFIPNKDKK